MSDLKAYDAGLLGDGGGGDVAWWQDYIRAELERADEHYRSHFEDWKEQARILRDRCQMLEEKLGEAAAVILPFSDAYRLANETVPSASLAIYDRVAAYFVNWTNYRSANKFMGKAKLKSSDAWEFESPTYDWD